MKRPASAARKKPPKGAAPRAFAQAEGASSKSQLLFRLVRARTAVLAAIQGLLAGAAERPLGEGKWNAREIVLHLIARDRIRLREMESALRGTRPSWMDISRTDQDLVNEEDLATLRHLNWEDALRQLHSTRQELIEAIESLPDDESEIWNAEHPFGWMMWRLPDHDLHHADAIKRWRAEVGA